MDNLKCLFVLKTHFHLILQKLLNKIKQGFKLLLIKSDFFLKFSKEKVKLTAL